MTIRIWEKPKSQTAVVDFKQPTTMRRYSATGSTIKTDILTALGLVMPAFDTTIDAVNGAVITLFPNKVDCEEPDGGGGNWDLVVHYENSSSTVDVAFTFGVQSVKIFTALEDVRSYNCLSPSSGGTIAAADAALADADTLFTDADSVDAAATLAATFAAPAIAAANVAGVDATVKTKTLLAASKLTATVADANTAVAASYSCGSATRDAANSALAGDATHAASAAADAVTFSGQVATAAASAHSDATAAATAASDATAAIPPIDIGGVSAAAAAAAGTAAASASSLDTAVASLSADATNASTAATAASDAVAGDTVPGATVPDFHRMIGVNGGEVEGVEIEVGSVEISITKKWVRAVLAANYLKTLADYTERTPTNDASYSFTWMGQTLTFARGTLRFRGAPVKLDSGAALEITYNFAYQRSITAADNLTIGDSAKILKEGWHGYWIFSKLGMSNGQPVMVPQSVHIYRVYPYLPFGPLSI